MSIRASPFGNLEACLRSIPEMSSSIAWRSALSVYLSPDMARD